jgi:glycosyltransferase involved in cell wall biosynthesis
VKENRDQPATGPDIEVSVVMPCLNEVETLQGCITEAFAALRDGGLLGEVVIADNGSTDGSHELARRLGARVVDVPRRGYGCALQAGFEAAVGEYVLMGDADGSYDFTELTRFVADLKAGHDLVIGCRLPRGGGTIDKGAMPWKHRWLGNPVLSWLGRVFFAVPVTDFHCGLRAFRRQAILALNLRCSGMEFASEMVVRASIKGLRIAEIPITLRRDGRSRSPHLRSWRDGWRHLRFMLLFTPRWLFLYPGFLLLLVGLAGMLLLIPAPLQVGGVTLDTNTMLVCAALVISGAQAVFFAILTKAYAVQAWLLAPDRRVQNLLRHQLVEWGIGIGVLLVTAGLAFVGEAFLAWRKTGFGLLSYPDSLRVVIPAVTAITLGVQSIFSGFVLAIFTLPVKGGPANSAPVE